MGIFKNIFTWWDGATIGTSLFSRRHGRQVGEDSFGNLYFEEKSGRRGATPRRWVMYKGSNDASRVDPEWHSWLHHSIDGLPDEVMPARRAWEQPAAANLTGTGDAFRPAGALDRGGRRAAATGDYEAWTPN